MLKIIKINGLKKNDNAVSEIIGYALALSIMTVLVTGAYLLTNSAVEQKTVLSAKAQAQNVADAVVDGYLNALTIHRNNPYSNYSYEISVPTSLAGKSYYVEATNRWVYVNSSDGKISKKSSLFNIPNNLDVDIDERISVSSPKLLISAPKSVEMYRFDFGPSNSTSPWKIHNSYTRVSNTSRNTLPLPVKDVWDNELNSWDYCTIINITNPTNTLIDYPYAILVRPDPSNFDYSKAENDGSDLRFYNADGEKRSYWIERWNPWNTSTSRIWVNLSRISADGYHLYMFHGNNLAQSESNGNQVFMFFEDFDVFDTSDPDSDLDLNVNWTFSSTGCSIVDNMLVLQGTTSNNAEATVKNVKIRNGVIEAKAKATGDDRDASIFARKNYTGGAEWRYIFHNGRWINPLPTYRDYTYFNCSISKNYTVIENPLKQWPKATSSDGSPIDQDWNRLIFTVNDGDYIGARYHYDDFQIDACARWNDTSDTFLDNCYDGSFGLINQHGDSESYFDWIFLRSFAGDTHVSDDASLEDQYPTAFIGGTCSHNFIWSNNLDSLKVQSVNVSNDLNKDFVYNNQPSTLSIYNLSQDTNYRVVFTVGDKNNPISNMDIRVNGVTMINNINLGLEDYLTDSFVTSTMPCSRCPSGKGKIEIRFSSSGGYWNICSLIVEKNTEFGKLEATI